MNQIWFFIVILAALAAGSCSAPASSPSYDDQLNEFTNVIAAKSLGSDIDHWIELKNLSGEWEKVGLVFGFVGDYDECVKAIEGLKKVNHARSYRCIPAQRTTKH